MPIADPRNHSRFLRQDKAMLHCDLRLRCKVASDLRFWAAISEPDTPLFCGISGDLAPSTRKSLAIAIVWFWFSKFRRDKPTPDPDTFENYRDTPPFLWQYFCKSVCSSWQKVVYTPPTCITMQLPSALRSHFHRNALRLTFCRAKLRRRILMTRAEVWAKNWAKNWAKFSAHFRASFAVQNDSQIFSPNSSQFITPCLVAESIKFHLRELLDLGGRKILLQNF